MDFVTAVKNGEIDSVRRMLCKEPELAKSEQGGVSAVLWAMYTGRRDIADLITDTSIPLNIYEAAATGHHERVAELLEENPRAIDSFSSDGFHSLGLACAFGNETVVKLLVDKCADTTLFTNNPNVRVAPIHSAAFGRNADAVRHLLEAGADPNLLAEGFTALHTAASNGDSEIVRLLLAKGADTSPKAPDGQTAYDLAMAAGHEETARIIAGK